MKVIIKKIYTGDMEERVLLEAMEDCNLSHYILFDRTFDENGIESNKHRHMYIFDSLDLRKGDFVYLYTRGKKDKDDNSFSNKRKTITYQLFWGIENQIWNNEGDTAYLLHYDDWMSKDGRKD